MEYSEITLDQQRQILKGRLAGWEADHFGHTINRQAMVANGVKGAELDNTDTAIRTLEASITTARDELSSIESAIEADKGEQTRPARTAD